MVERTRRAAGRIDFAALRGRLARAEQSTPDAADLEPIFRERARLLGRAHQVDDDGTGGREHLRFRVGGVVCAVPLLDVETILPPPPLARIPGAPAHLSYVIHVDGRVVPVLDLSVLFGRDRLEPAASRHLRVLLLRGAASPIAMLVDGDLEVMRIEDAGVVPAAPGTWTAEVSRGTAPDLTCVLDAARLRVWLRAARSSESKEKRR